MNWARVFQCTRRRVAREHETVGPVAMASAFGCVAPNYPFTRRLGMGPVILVRLHDFRRLAEIRSRSQASLRRLFERSHLCTPFF
jgi:hypothetical protein